MKQNIFKIGTIEGLGHSKTVARDNAIHQAGEAVTRLDSGPIVFAAPPHCWERALIAVVVAPNVHGWEYGWLEASSPRARTICHGMKTSADALWHAVKHAADLCISATTTIAQLDAIEQWAAGILKDPSQAIVLRAEMRDRVASNQRYIAARDSGKTETEAHREACRY